MPRPVKKRKVTLDEEGAKSRRTHSPAPTSNAGTPNVGPADGDYQFKINEDFARRYEHNKKREERHKLEEKYGSGKSSRRANGQHEGLDFDDLSQGSSSSSEDEDDEGLLATEALDREIAQTLNAIRSKDPRVYDKSSSFFSETPVNDLGEEVSKDKPMFLRDYHRKNLLNGYIGGENEEPEQVQKTYAQEQDDLKSEIVKEMHAQNDEGSIPEDADDGSDGGTGFLVLKSKPQRERKKVSSNDLQEKRLPLDVASADKDPENFLSNFLSSRAWVPTSTVQPQPFESDEEDEEQRADEFEQAYNFRFENPAASNEKLMSHARDAVAKYTVRRAELSGRKKTRERDRESKENEKQAMRDEKLRLRKLQIEEAEEKVRQIKAAAGLRKKNVEQDEWAKFLDENWDNDQWEKEMERRFGDTYYAELESDGSAEERPEPNNERKKQKKPKKPKWEDEININDLVPDFDDDEKHAKPIFSISDDDVDEPIDGPAVDEYPTSAKRKDSKALKAERQERRKAARNERRRIEELVDDRLALDVLPQISSQKRPTAFRYRETSPQAFGLSAQDILMASDSQLNQYAGLKKLASFRDGSKKQKDRKRLGKKARLRQWRKETFGDESGPLGDAGPLK
ncbi:MAG: KRRI-Interacting protein 1 [Piccolia ochrophora]|nr:MAG: KRRI-Interacting protein 1 [Piccolia ochrophora]